MTQVLVVDDSYTLRQLIRAILEPAGYRIIEASDGEEGLAALRSSAEPLVVLLDYQMPNLDGMEVLQAVSEVGGPLLSHDYIVISANQATFPSVFIDLLRHLSIRVLPKPFEREALLATVAQAAERLASPAEDAFSPDGHTDAE
jgi:CheY-like chemotaxis protein